MDNSVGKSQGQVGRERCVKTKGERVPMKKKMNKSERWRTYWAIFIENSVLASIYSFRVGILPQRWRVLILYVAYPSLYLYVSLSLSLSLVSGCSSVRKKSKRAVGTHHQPSPFAFPGNCSRSLSLQSRYIFIEKLKREKEREGGGERTRKKEPSIFYYRCPLSVASPFLLLFLLH